MRARNLRLVALVAGGLFVAAPGWARDRPIDAGRSTVRVRVSTTGAFARTYVIEAPLMDGSLGEPADPHLQIAFDARRLRVVEHPALSAGDREDMQRRMLGPDVLDVNRFPWISYHSLTMERLDRNGWLVRGELNLHGRVHPLTVTVAVANNRYTGSATFRQSEFGIEPVTALNGVVKVKDEIVIAFDIVPEP